MPDLKDRGRKELIAEIERLRATRDDLKLKLKDAPADVELLRAANKRLLKDARKAEGRMSLVMDAVKSAVAEQDFHMDLPPAITIQRGAVEETKALLHITDTQIGKKSASYNTAIARERILEVCRKAASCCQNHNRSRGIRELHLLLGGDMIENEIIFPHQPHEIDSSALVQSMVSVPTIFRDAIMYLRSYFETIHVYCVSGNHGRPGAFNSGNHPETNLDTAAYMMMREMLNTAQAENPMKGHTIKVHIPRGFFIVDENFFDHYPLLVHGDKGIKGGYGGFPYYGVARAISKWSVSIPQPWKLLFFGHFHGWQGGEAFGRNWYCGGTLESGNEYARANFDASGRPKQRLLLFTRKQLICELPIYANYKFKGQGFAPGEQDLI
jgi:hypothetical protein